MMEGGRGCMRDELQAPTAGAETIVLWPQQLGHPWCEERLIRLVVVAGTSVLGDIFLLPEPGEGQG